MENNQLAQQQKPVSALVKFNSLLSQENIKKRFEEALGKKSPMFISNLTTIMAGSAELQKCEHMSIISSALMAASMDLPLTPGLGFAGIVPYFDGKSQMMKAQFIIQKKGYIQLAQRTGLFKIINVSEVYEGEIKSHNRFTGEYIFDENSKTSENIIGYVSYFRLVNGFEKYFFMNMEKLDKHAKRYSKAFQKGIGKWADKEEGGYEQMCEKTVLKLNLSTYAPLSTDINMMNAIIYDQAVIKDLDAKEFDYEDNPESKTTENKEVMELGENKTITVNQNGNQKSEAISQSTVRQIDKANNGKHKDAEDVQVIVPESGAVIPETNEEPVPWTEEYLAGLKADIVPLAQKRLPADKYKLIQAIPQKKTNKLIREALLAFQDNNLDVWIINALKQPENTSGSGEGQSTAPVENIPQNNANEPADDLSILGTKPLNAPTTKEATESFNSQRKTPEPKGELFPKEEAEGPFKIGPINPTTGKRAMMDAVKLYQHLSSIGIGDGSVTGGLDNFCKTASEEDIQVLIQKNT
jgi:recombination protein RecT